MTSVRPFLRLVWTVGVLPACSALGLDDKGPPGLRVVSGGGVRDTIDALISEPLVIEFRGRDGRPVPGAIVRLQSPVVRQDGPSAFSGAIVSFASANAVVPRFNGFHDDTTDKSGRVRVHVRPWVVAGSGDVTIRAVASGEQITSRFVTLPGRAAGVSSAPVDTIVNPGGTVDLRTFVVDRAQNRTADAISYGTIGPAVTLQGGRVTAVVPGRAIINVAYGQFLTRSFVSVVPPGELLVESVPRIAGQSSVAWMMRTDLSNARIVARGQGLGNMNPRLAPNKNQIVYAAGMPLSALYVSDLFGNARRLLQPPVSLQSESRARYGPEGTAIYFSGDGALWRTRPDGSGSTTIGPSPPVGVTYSHVAPSPDGGTLAFAKYFLGDWYLLFLDLASGLLRDPGLRGGHPAWSPDGQMVAYMDREDLKTVRPDGTGVRTVINLGLAFPSDEGIDWSPDGRWLVARTTARLAIIDLRTGEWIPLIGTENLGSPTWH